MNMINAMNNNQNVHEDYVRTYKQMFNNHNPQRERLAVENVEIRFSIVLFIASLTIDFLPLPGFLDMLPFSM